MSSTTERVLPELQEELHVAKRSVPGAGFRLTKRVHERMEPAQAELTSTRLTIVRRVVDRALADDELPRVRQDGNTTIFPVIEERLVTMTRRFLKEEVHVSRIEETRMAQETVALRTEEILIEPLADAAIDDERAL